MQIMTNIIENTAGSTWGVKLVSKDYKSIVIQRHIEFSTKRGVEFTIEPCADRLCLKKHTRGISWRSLHTRSGWSVELMGNVDEIKQWFAEHPRSFTADDLNQINKHLHGRELYFEGRLDDPFDAFENMADRQESRNGNDYC